MAQMNASPQALDRVDHKKGFSLGNVLSFIPVSHQKLQPAADQVSHLWAALAALLLLVLQWAACRHRQSRGQACFLWQVVAVEVALLLAVMAVRACTTRKD